MNKQTDNPNDKKNCPVAFTAERYTESGQFSSVEWAVNENGQTVIDGQSGYADYHAQSAIPANALYRIYSMTKPLVSVAALMLIEQQKLKLYDPVAKYIPAFAKQKILRPGGSLQHNPVPANIEHLLTHRAGLSYDFHIDCPVGDQYRHLSLADDGSRSLTDLVNCLAETPAVCAPGERWHYSYATDVLARVIEIASGQTIADFLQTQLLSPLGMSDTAFFVKKADQHRIMPMFGTRSLGSIFTTPPTVQTLSALDVDSAYPADESAGFQRGGVGLFSTTADYLQFAEFMRTGQTHDKQPLLSNAMFEMLWANRISPQQLPLSIGLNRLPGYGWNLAGRVMLDVGQALIVTSNGEGGWAGAASTYFWVDRARSISGVVMSQYLGSALPLGADIQSAATVELS